MGSCHGNANGHRASQTPNHCPFWAMFAGVDAAKWPCPAGPLPLFERLGPVGCRFGPGETVELHHGLRGPPVTTFMRRVPSNTVVPSARASPRPLPVRSNAAALLRQAIKWREELDSGQIPNQAAIARREGLSRARVTQILSLLREAVPLDGLPSDSLTNPNGNPRPMLRDVSQ